MDFLGLRNLTVLDDAVQLLRRREPGFRIEDAPEEDKATYDMLAAGRTVGVFQLESTGMPDIYVRRKPGYTNRPRALMATPPTMQMPSSQPVLTFLRIRVYTVSYTHLDVYKRQSLVCYTSIEVCRSQTQKVPWPTPRRCGHGT